MAEFKPGDHIWNSSYPFVVGVVLQLGSIGPWKGYAVKSDSDGQTRFIFEDEARHAA